MKKLLLTLIIGMFLISFVSALEIDNVKSYDIKTQTMTIKNAFGLPEYLGGETLAEIQLVSDLNVNVIDRGEGIYQKVAEINLKNYKTDYSDAFGKMDAYNVRAGMEKISRDIKLKYRITVGQEDVPYFTKDCGIRKNSLGEDENYCNQVVAGYNQEDVYEWVDFIDVSELPSQDVVIGLFADVQPGEKVDWIPDDWFGERITQWATWTEGLNNHLELFYKWDTISGVVVEDSVAGEFNLTNVNSVGINFPGLINTAYNFSRAAQQGVTNTTGTTTTACYDNNCTISLWKNVTGAGGAQQVLYYSDRAGIFRDGIQVTVESANLMRVRYTENGGANHDVTFTEHATKQWENIVIVMNITTMTVFRNGTQEGLVHLTGAVGSVPRSFTMGYRLSPSDDGYNGLIDEVGIWNRTLTPSEITDLYNDGAGISYIGDFDLDPTVTLNKPVDSASQTNNTIIFNWTAQDDGILENSTLYINGVPNQTFINGVTNFSSIQVTKTMAEGSHSWNVKASDNATVTQSAFAPSNFTVVVDTLSPKMNVSAPVGTIPYHLAGNNLSLNWTINDSALDACKFEYGGANTTLVCGANQTSFNVTSTQNRTGIMYANDTTGRTTVQTINWDYKVFENSQTFNDTTYETALESFSTNVAANSSLTGVKLEYNGTTNYTLTQSGNTYSTSFDIPLSHQGNNTLRFIYDYVGTNIYSQYSYQYVSPINFSICGAAPQNTPFLNITFQDESDFSSINASIPTSTFEYYLGSGTVNKTLTYVNSSNAFSYAFCGSPPDRTLNVNPELQFKQGTDYPQRIWNPPVQSYSNTTTNQILYLLNSIDGIYVTFQVTGGGNQIIGGVEIIANRTISGTPTTVGQGTTGADGTATFWLNPDFEHSFTFSKTGFTTFSSSFAPTQSSYTIVLGGGATTPDNFHRGIAYSVLPRNNFLLNDTTYSFEYNLTSDFWDVTEYGLVLRLSNGTIIGSDSETSVGTPATLNYNVNNQSIIYMDYYWLITGNYTNGTSSWVIQNTQYTGWSIATFFTDLTLYLDSGLFGLDDFGRLLIIFLMIFTISGFVSFKYGLTSPLSVSTTIFSVIFFLDVVAGVIPPIQVINNIPVEHLLTYLSALVLTLLIWNEVPR